ncbi:hypothetical protein D9756_002844 [Leucocoprinus leucothites]|uniref:Uncharacterized protein n=1 Tax=Leucocoprinus leucothites TaxID=201217 RepID=A0A8H5LLU9_9AGAR|nr:hypothetical protein D9756_002844 [Leucoagaricus leucothites]
MTAPSSLSIPLDIIEIVAEGLSTNRSTFQALALTCHEYLFICQRRLFRHVDLSESGGYLPRRLEALHEALVHHPEYLGSFIKTLTISLPDYLGYVSYVTRDPLLPSTLLSFSQLRALHITYFPLPKFPSESLIEGEWKELAQGLVSLLSLETLESVVFDSILELPIDLLGCLAFVKHLCIRHCFFASSSRIPSEFWSQRNSSSSISRNRLRSLTFEFCDSGTLRKFIEYVTENTSTIAVDGLENLVYNPWTELSCVLAVEILETCREELRELTWPLRPDGLLDNLRVDNLPSLEKFTILVDLDGDQPGNPLDTLLHLINSINSAQGSLFSPLAIHIRLINYTLPSPSRFLQLFDWMSLCDALSNLSKRRALRHLSIEFTCSCLWNPNFQTSGMGEDGFPPRDLCDFMGKMKKEGISTEVPIAKSSKAN